MPAREGQRGRDIESRDNEAVEQSVLVRATDGLILPRRACSWNIELGPRSAGLVTLFFFFS